ncbi:helix-turn-helix domain-containing protein [Peptacetobacter sp.]|uniref:helix-turn-helix domain-containing protein n=1 Tax=Peptacetobacter sp. TaxID=2991975 RepID=UPI0026133BCC|nr:helix-turn-helix transcriptional regulator [Peptacetobacter sp.]MEE0452323.1 helix-turn-helix transcriptional regulator [Peptacetobacter sp.]
MYFKNDKELFKTIGNNLRIFRKKANLTQAQLVESVGISISYLSKIEANNCDKSISLSILNQIANFLEIDIINFFKEE